MKNFWLTKEQLTELREAHRAERNKHAAYKINAIILLGSGWKLKAVKEALLIDDETLRSYIEKYNAGGIDALIKTHYTGSSARLNNLQQKRLCEELDSTIYLSAGAIITYIEEAFTITYTPGGVRDLLHRLGYVFKKPKLIPGNPDVDAQEEFIEYYEEFMENKGPDVEVVFVDAVHPEHNAMAAYGWIKKGEKRCLKTNSGRQRLNLHGAINAETMEMTVIESETVDKDSTLQLLDLLDSKYCYAERVCIILDNARYHYSKEVKAFIKEHPRLRLVFLPPYSPELNLIERVWKFFKKNVLYNKYYADLKEFRAASIEFFSTIDQHADSLASLLSGGFERAQNT